VLQYRIRLRPGHSGEPLDELLDRGPAFKVLEQRAHRNTRAAKNPGAAKPLRVAFRSAAGRPVKHARILPTDTRAGAQTRRAGWPQHGYFGKDFCMNTPFGHFAAWRLALRAPGLVRAPADIVAQQRWEGEGGNTEIRVQRKRRADEPEKAMKS
jgi:hypothetical protein